MTNILLIGACLLMPAPSWVPAAYSSPIAGDAPSTPWWKDARLGELNLLISEALVGNEELSAARARVTQASAQRVVARSPLLPTLSATSNLNPAAQVVVAVTMFAGRFGPLTIALFMAGRERQDPVRFATERIRIG